MAVVVTPVTSKMKLRFQTGLDGEGNPVYKNKTISNVKVDALDQDVLDTANALSTLLADALAAVFRIDDSDLAEGV
ncbi:DUF1659 domain-containing protein [Dehalobacterium formicoaceticum]|uniref:DUF1659 domain-containing protein n=1 Tax=Dehalobacterium formicoaceticum TaxID=51515 RepID=A0ABT1Y6A6_9FIRM|nr:DUF1659 domain-containing protein [Dehalobacterium formicoaceticum]MCR6546418.1 DUF1659 domain-containing protein [Dehalobacterium formicoaceticum]